MRILHTTSVFPALAGTAIALGSPGPAAAGNAELGKRTAQEWCADCHLVSLGQKTPVPDTAPTFMELAQDPRGPGYIGTFLQAPHFKNMKGLEFSRYDIEDIVAYVSSLRGK